MAALLSSRSALVSRSTSLSGGAIAGATIGAVFGALLLFLCCLPFIRRAWRKRADRRQYGDDAAAAHQMGEGPDPSIFARPHFGDAFRQITSPRILPASWSRPGPPPRPQSAKDYDLEAASGVPSPNGSSVEKPPRVVSSPGSQAPLCYPSPVSPPLASPDDSAPPPRSVSPLSRSATGTFTADLEPPSALSTFSFRGAFSRADVDPSSTRQSTLDSNPQTGERAATVMSEGITEEPEAMAQDAAHGQHSRKSSHRLSNSIRKITAMVRQASTSSNDQRSDTARSTSRGLGDFLPPSPPGPPVFGPVDTEARGEAYSYYHDVDAPPAPYPLSTTLPSSSSQPHVVTPISPVSPVIKAENEMPTDQFLARQPTFGLDKDVARGLPDSGPFPTTHTRAAPPGPPRTDTLPPQSIVSDVPSPSLSAKEESGVNPMDIMKPTTDSEARWMVEHELKMSQSPPPTDLSHSGHPAVEIKAEPSSQPTPDSSPEPEHRRPPNIEVTSQDVQMAEPSATSSTPPPSSALSNSVTTPNDTPDTRPTPYTNTPSPASHDGSSSEKPDSSPRAFPCDQCHRVFDQFHKLK